MNAGFYIYLFFVVSWFTHLSARIPALGYLRIDMLLVAILLCLIFFGTHDIGLSKQIKTSRTNNILKTLILYIIITLPFVQWPGSVIDHGFQNIIKAIVFYYFTIYFVTSHGKLKLFILVFVAVQSLRIIEPVYLHITQGYWGSSAHMANWEEMDRLSGAPYDVVNPNGLAYIILTVIPFYYFLYKASLLNKIMAITLIPLSIYALMLTGSRSGLIGLIVILGCILLKSKKKILLLSLILVGGMITVGSIGSNFKDRYASIYSSDSQNAATAKGRIEGIKACFIVAMRRPLFGHGIGTSQEANSHFANSYQPAHNLYAEIAQELGFIGLIIFILLIKSIISNYKESQESLNTFCPNDQFIQDVNNALQVWLVMNILFSFASYGLSSYEWYLFAGLSVTIRLIISQMENQEKPVPC
jgi:O-antigen ligase